MPHGQNPFPVASGPNPASFPPVDPEPLHGEKREALLGLLDDPSPAVRGALQAYFLGLGLPAAQLLRDAATGSNRILAWHARRYLEELQFTDPVAEFRDFIRAQHYELEAGSLLLSRTVYPKVDAAGCTAALDALGDRCRELIVEPATAREKCRVLNRVLFHESGFRGNVEDYTDPRNSFLDLVMQRRRGIPLSLSIVYLLVARRVGLVLEPVGLPGHFVVGCFLTGTPFFIDPFEGGAMLTGAEVSAALRLRNLHVTESELVPTPVREVLCRTCRNLANHYRASGDEPHSQLFATFVAEFAATYAQP
jgi:regulator of sirC expression with transglutaminase-like and TPR domain